MEVQDRVVVVTGGASGIGRAVARAMGRAGASGVVVADLDTKGAAAVAAEIEAAGGKGHSVRCDVSSEADVQALVRATEEHFGPIDVFCANAGVLTMGGVDAPDEIWDRAWSINVKSHVYAARAVLPGMVERGSGYLVHTASAAGLLMQLGAAPYTVSKHAIVSLAEYLSVTYYDAGVRVSCLCPQAVATNLGATSRAVLAGKEPESPRQSDGSNEIADSPRVRGTASGDGVVTPDRCAELVLDAIRDERFLVLPHPEVEQYEQRKAGDRERWLRGMRRAWAQMSAFQNRGRS